MFILNIMVDLLTPNCVTISMNFVFSLNFPNTLLCWYAKGPYIKYVGGGLEDFCGGHEII